MQKIRKVSFKKGKIRTFQRSSQHTDTHMQALHEVSTVSQTVIEVCELVCSHNMRDGILILLSSLLRIRNVYPGSRILIFTHPGSRIPDLVTRISDPKKQQQNRRVKKIVAISIFGATNFTKLKIILFLKC